MLIVTPPALMPVDDIDDVLGDNADALPITRGVCDILGPLPAVRITREFANRLLAGCPAGAEGPTIEQLTERINETGQPQSFAIGGTLAGKVALAAGHCRNVIGVLRPDARAAGLAPAPVIVVGAHYDHIPATGQLAKDVGPGIRPGAGDNASGDATVLTLARALAATPGRRFIYMFMAFDSEEIGFAGSRYYVQHPWYPIKRVRVMVNIDEVGYVGPLGVMILGRTLDPALARAIGRASSQSSLGVAPVPFTSSQRLSDQAAFVRAGVPTLFFYGYPPAVHHSRLDTADRVNAAGGAATARLVFRLLRELEADR